MAYNPFTSGPAASINSASVSIATDQAQTEGLVLAELLQQILIELRIANYQRSEYNNSAGKIEDPATLRTDTTFSTII
jgi:hypothetical protein